MGNIMIDPIKLNADDIRKINLLMPKLASPVIKVLKQFARDDKEALEILKLHTYLLLEFDKPYPFWGEENASIPNNSEEIHKKMKSSEEKPEKETVKKWRATGNVQLCCTDVTEYNIEKLAALFEKLWPGHGKRKAAQIFEKGNLIKNLSKMQWQTILDPGKKMSKPDLCLRLAEIGINARIG